MHSRWKLVQMAGRVGRRQGEKALFITVVPQKQRYRGACFGMFSTNISVKRNQLTHNLFELYSHAS